MYEENRSSGESSTTAGLRAECMSVACSVLWHGVVLSVVTRASEELVASIFTAARTSDLRHQYKTSMWKALPVLYFLYFRSMEPGSSVSIVSGYGLDDRSSIPAEVGDFSCSLCVQTDSGAHPASCPMGIGDPFPGGKEPPGCDADHSPPSTPEVKNE
jgi:hypothetical protein